MRASGDDEVEGGERQRRRRRGWRRRVWRGRRGWLLTLTLTRVRSRGFSRRSHSELSRRSREAAKSGLGRSGAHRTRSRAAERSSDALPCRSVALRRLGASNAGPRHWRLSSAAAEASTAVLVSALGFFEPFLGLTLDWAGSTLALRCLRTSVPSSITSRCRGVSSCRGRALQITLLPIFLESPVREHSHAGCLVALGPVLRRRRTYDGCFERCAPAVPQHDRPRASTIPLPAHSPCTAASEQSPAAIDPCGDVGCLAGFRQEGSPPYMPCMRYSIKGDTKNWNSLTRYMIRADLDCVFGKS